jgi:hypothetical protein
MPKIGSARSSRPPAEDRSDETWKTAVVVVAAEEYKRLQRLGVLKAPNFADHLLAMPTDDGEFERLRGSLSETNL